MSKRYCDEPVFPYVEGGELKGIINYLTEKCGRNVHEKGIVWISSSSGDFCWKVVNHDDNWWVSTSALNSWVSFDFKEKSVALQHYTLRSGGMEPFFISWRIEGSNDGRVWKSIDNRNTRELCGVFITKTYECSRAISGEFFRFIRMRQTDKDSMNFDYLALCNIEFFGRVRLERCR
jgi:hypothetical protein